MTDQQPAGQPNLSDHERNEMRQLFVGITDPTLMILRVHLYTEHVMERLILAKLPRGDRLLESGNLSYSQKVSLVSAFNCIHDSCVASLRALNKVRNACSHERQKVITVADIDLIGRPFGPHFTTLRNEHSHQLLQFLGGTLGFVCGWLLSETLNAEKQAAPQQRKPT